jgi:DNA-binding XRE family transcriptional regulator
MPERDGVVARENERLRAELAAARDELAHLQARVDDLLAQANNRQLDPRAVLRGIAQLRRQLDELEVQQVTAALARGFSYAELAAELGVTRQSVHQKHSRRQPPPRSS